jgi:hypothetical protein
MALFNIPELVTQMTILTFYTPANGQPVFCNTSGVITVDNPVVDTLPSELVTALENPLCPQLFADGFESGSTGITPSTGNTQGFATCP